MSGPSAAALELHEKLNGNPQNKFYDWKPMNEDYTVYLRTPKEYEGRDEPWMKAEQPELIHVCDVEKLLDVFHRRDKRHIADYCGYVRDDACQKCASPVPGN